MFGVPTSENQCDVSYNTDKHKFQNASETHRKSKQEAGFPYTTVSNQDELEEIVIVALFGGGTGRHDGS